jgi:hypothetical protein
MENDIEQIAFALDFPADGGARTQGNWASWEQQRTRSFFSPVDQTIDDRGLVGRIRNWTLLLEMKRDNGGFSGSWTFSAETKIGPWRLERDGQAIIQLKGGGNVLISVPAPGFAMVCQDWRQQSWSGALALDQFEAITAVGFTGNTTARRC